MQIKLNFQRFAQDVTQALNQVEEKAIQTASRRAMKKTMKHLKTRVVRHLSQKYHVKQRSLKKRVWSNMDLSSGNGKLWVGLNPVELYQLGNPRQTSYGAEAGGYKVPGAFLSRVKNKTSFWQRVGREAYPIEMVRVNIFGSEQRSIRQLVESNALPWYTKAFDHEFRREILKGVRG